MPPSTPPDRPALFSALACFTVWGLFPLLFQAVGHAGAGPWELLAWRILASLPTCVALVWVTGQGAAWSALLRDRRAFAALAASAVLIGANWAVFIWAVQNGETLATSLGYYINPLLNVGVGAILFRERVGPVVKIALALAAAGVALQAVAVGGVPWIPLVLAATFCAYGVIRKQVPVEAQTGLLAETVVLCPFAAAFAAWEATQGMGAFGHNLTASVLLLACGPATALPLVAFAAAARRLPLGVLGFLQFIQPTIVFAVGALQGEPVTPLRLAAFACIWAGVAVFVTGAWRERRALA
jgi:chloramphenicol-sensitive protein RarD